MIYTSGSTGTPKGAANTHAGRVNDLLSIQDILQLGADDRILQKTAVGMGDSVREWMHPLTVGACLVIAEPEGHRDAIYLARVIDEQSITLINFIPSMLPVFLNVIYDNVCSSLTQIVSSGEALSASVQQQCFDFLPHTTLWNISVSYTHLTLPTKA